MAAQIARRAKMNRWKILAAALVAAGGLAGGPGGRRPQWRYDIHMV